MADKLEEKNVQVNDATRVASKPETQPIPVPQQEQPKTKFTLFDLARAARNNSNGGKVKKTAIVSVKDRRTGKVIEEPHEIELEESSVEEMF